MAKILMAEVLQHSEHKGVRRFTLYLIAEQANDYDRIATVYMRQLADDLNVTMRDLQKLMRHLESSGEITVYTRPNDACNIRLNELEYHFWPDSYVRGELIDRRKRNAWTWEHEQMRKDARREAARAGRSQESR